MAAFIAEGQKNKVARARVVGHRTIATRFDRYKRTAGYNGIVNSRQFNGPAAWPTDYVYPDTYFDDRFTVAAGSIKFECHHGRGETDDACWVYIPQRKVLCTGDFIIWASPNAGNPQKAVRYAREWAEALRAMVKVGAEVLLPGHGVPVFGALRVRQVLIDTAEYLQSLYDQTVALMNTGTALDEIIWRVAVPAKFTEKPYLQAVYDEPEFIVRNIWRRPRDGSTFSRVGGDGGAGERRGARNANEGLCGARRGLAIDDEPRDFSHSSDRVSRKGRPRATRRSAKDVASGERFSGIQIAPSTSFPKNRH
jgi:glyoxylase-like metal-dependent hydrolase (beta-lactamase superfamily II)